MPELHEDILPDDHPIRIDCYYIADGEVITSGISGTVCDLKRVLGASEIRRCDIFGRLDRFLEAINERA